MRFIDFGRTFGTGQPAVAYAHTRLTASADSEFTIPPLLDFTLAPALPFIYKLQREKSFANRDHYLNRPRITGDLHGQAPLLWCAAALLR